MPGETNINDTPQDHGINAGPGHAAGDLDEIPPDEKQQEIIDDLAEAAKEDDQGKEGGPGEKHLDEIGRAAEERGLKFFVVHKATGKVEIMDYPQAGVISYAFKPHAVTPNDWRYMLQAVHDGAGLEKTEDGRLPVRILVEPEENIRYGKVILDIRNRTDIVVGTMELWRHTK